MTKKSAQEVLYESEAAFRLVDHELTGMLDARDAAEAEPFAATMMSFGELPQILEQANAQILGVLSRLRASRAARQNAETEKLAMTHERIRESTTATKDAAINVRDSCDRATKMIDELDAIDGNDVPDREKAASIRSALREELSIMTRALQFPDSTLQPLALASALLVETEERLLEVVRLLDRNAEGRLALADEASAAVRVPAA